MEKFLLSLFEGSVIVSLSVVILFFLKSFLLKKVFVKWYYWAYLILFLRLLLPVSFTVSEPIIKINLPERTALTAMEPVRLNQPQEIINTNTPTTIEISADNNSIKASEKNTGSKSTVTITVYDIINIAYVIGLFAFLLFQAVCYIILKRDIKKNSLPCSNIELIKCLDDICEQMHIKRKIQVMYYSGAATPMMAGFYKPILLLPKKEYDIETLDFILRHEMVHYKRRDLWYKLLMLIANSLHWYNPFIYLLRRDCEKILELTCDSEVVKNTDKDYRAKYCKAIVNEIESGKANTAKIYMSTAFNNDKKTLKQRFNSILDIRKRRKGIALIVLLLIIVFSIGIFIACEDINKPVKENIDTAEITDNKPIEEIIIPDRPTDEEIDALMKESFFFFAAYGYGNDIMVGNTETCKIINGMEYHLVVEEYRDYEAWAERIKSSFKKELAEVYLQNIGIINLDGMTYAIGGGGSGEYGFDLYTYEIKSAEKGKAVLEITIPFAAWMESVQEPMKSKVEMTYIDGKWKISYEEYSFLYAGFEKIKEAVTPDTAIKLIDTDMLISKAFGDAYKPYIESILYQDNEIFVFTVKNLNDQKSTGNSGYNGWGYCEYKTGKTVYYEYAFAFAKVNTYTVWTNVNTNIIFYKIAAFNDLSVNYEDSGIMLFSVYNRKTDSTRKVNTVNFGSRLYHYGNNVFLSYIYDRVAVLSLGKSMDECSYNKRLVEVYNVSTGELENEFILYLDNIKSEDAYGKLFETPNMHPRVSLELLYPDIGFLTVTVEDDTVNTDKKENISTYHFQYQYFDEKFTDVHLNDENKTDNIQVVSELIPTEPNPFTTEPDETANKLYNLMVNMDICVLPNLVFNNARELLSPQLFEFAMFIIDLDKLFSDNWEQWNANIPLTVVEEAMSRHLYGYTFNPEEVECYDSITKTFSRSVGGYGGERLDELVNYGQDGNVNSLTINYKNDSGEVISTVKYSIELIYEADDLENTSPLIDWRLIAVYRTDNKVE